jgi:phage-related protein
MLDRLFRDNLLAGSTIQWRKSYKDYKDMAEAISKNSKAKKDQEEDNLTVIEKTEILGSYSMVLQA